MREKGEIIWRNVHTVRFKKEMKNCGYIYVCMYVILRVYYN